MSQRYLGGIITANPTLPTLSSASGVWTLEQDFQNSASITPQVIGRSVRLRNSASAYLNRTFSTGSTTRWTWSAWFKRGAFVANSYLFSANNINGEGIAFTSSNQLLVAINGAALLISNAVYRDPSSWYHVVVASDMSNATAALRCRVYVNGVEVTSWATDARASYTSWGSMNSAVQHNIGITNANSAFFDGYFTEMNFIGGQQLPATSFGAFDSNGVWQPLSYRGTYGTNGFYLNFSDNSAATAAAIGKDYSGNGNNWTPNNISVTAGVTYDSMLDVPTMYADGGNGRGNYAVLNPLDIGPTSALAAGNLNFTTSSSANYSICRGTLGVSSGKWYWEIEVNSSASANMIGVANADASLSQFVGQNANGWGYYSNGFKYNNNSGVAYGASFTTGDILGVALDMDAGTITFYKNNISQGQAYSGITGTIFPAVSDGSSVSSASLNANFGQRPFAYTPPTGFLALNTQNMTAATINNGAQYMAATLYTGTGASLAISNGANNPIATTFQPDFVWIKDRTATNYHVLFNSIVGGTNYLCSNATQAETGAYGNITFNSNGFTESSGGTGIDNVGTNAHNYVGWQWKAGGTAVSNTNGSITSSVSANTTAGFSVVTWTGTGGGAVQTFGHGLGVAPSMVISKCRGTAVLGTDSWVVYFTGFSINNYMFLNGTAAKGSSANYLPALPTSSVFSVGGTSANVNNESGLNYVAYCFAAVKGYSAFGSYTGNGSTDGPFVYCGFRPRFIMVKGSSNASSWQMFDTSRSTYNVVGNTLWADLSSAEGTGTARVDLLSNGFKVRAAAGTDPNVSGATYIYMAFAENPFNISRAR